MKQAFCENCRKLVNYTIEVCKQKTKIKGKEYCYQKEIATCEECKNEINVNEIMEQNLRKIDEEYRKQENIITIKEIEEILNKYAIGKKPLARLLGWGEVTIIRYLKGDIPSKPYSEELRRIAQDKEYMKRVLIENKEKIPSSTYHTVLTSIEQTNRMGKQIEEVSQYLIYRCEEITNLTLEKLLYYAQGFYQAFFDEPLFEEDCEAWVHGPVYPEIYDKYKMYQSKMIEEQICSEAVEGIKENKKELLDAIVRSFGYYSGKALEKMTHMEDPWIKARNGSIGEERGKNSISKEEMKRYFKNIKEQYNMRKVTDIHKYSEDQFEKICNY